MDDSLVHEQNVSPPREEITAVRTVAFPDEDEKEKPSNPRPKGVEMSRSLTQEDRVLAAAGYEHLEVANKPGAPAVGENVDIQEHRLPFDGLEAALKTSFDPKDASKSEGLTPEEAAARLKRDGRNVLTPPKKKSALGKVWIRPTPIL